jgi:hypothetical protein
MAEILSLFRDSKGSRTLALQIFDMPMVHDSATCPNRWMALIFVGIFTMDLPDFLSTGFSISRTPTPRYPDAFQGFHSTHDGFKPCETPVKSND